MYHGWQSLVPCDSPSGYRYTHPQTQHELARLVENVVEPLGPTLLSVPGAQSDVAFLEAFASEMFARRGTYGWCGSWAGDVYHVLMYAHLQPEIVFDETIVDRGLDGFRVLVMPDCDVLTEVGGRADQRVPEGRRADRRRRTNLPRRQAGHPAAGLHANRPGRRGQGGPAEAGRASFASSSMRATSVRRHVEPGRDSLPPPLQGDRLRVPGQRPARVRRLRGPSRPGDGERTRRTNQRHTETLRWLRLRPGPSPWSQGFPRFRTKSPSICALGPCEGRS